MSAEIEPYAGDASPTVSPPPSTLPSPAAATALAFLAGLVALAVNKEAHFLWPSPRGGVGMILQGLWLFPTAAGCVIAALGVSRHTRSGHIAARLFWPIVAYLLISVLAVLLMGVQAWVKDLASASDPFSFAVTWDALQSSLLALLVFSIAMGIISPEAYIAFALGFIVLCAWPLLRKPVSSREALPASRTRSGVAGRRFAAVMAASTVAYAIFLIHNFTDTRQSVVAARAKSEMLRAGLLLRTDDEALHAARAAVDRERGEVPLLRWLADRPTRTSYVVAQNGGGDFKQLPEALAHLAGVLEHNESRLKNEANRLAGPIFTLQMKLGTYEGNVEIAGPILVRNEGAVAGVVLRPSDAGTAVVVLKARSPFVHGPALERVTVAGTPGADAIEANTADAAGLRIEGSRIHSADGRCGVVGGGLFRANEFTGHCGASITQEALLTGNEFVAMSGPAIIAWSDARLKVQGNRFDAASRGALLLAADRASVKIEGADLSVNGNAQALLELRDASAVSVRKSTLANPGNVCAWLRAASTRLDVEGSRLQNCGGPDHAPIVADAGGRISLRESSFALVAERSTLAQLVKHEGAELSVDSTTVDRPTQVETASASSGPSARGATDSPEIDYQLRVLLPYYNEQYAAMLTCAAEAAGREPQLSMTLGMAKLATLFGNDEFWGKGRELSNAQIGCVRRAMERSLAAYARALQDPRTCEAMGKSLSRYADWWSANMGKALVLDVSGDKGSVSARVEAFHRVASEAFSKSTPIGLCRQ